MTSVAQRAIDLAAFLIGLVVLMVPCYLMAWEDCISTENPNQPPHTIDQWSWPWLRAIYNNPEDGVSGRYARVASPDGRPVYVPYQSLHPTAGPRLLAYLWSAWRNSSDQLKYTFNE